MVCPCNLTGVRLTNHITPDLTPFLNDFDSMPKVAIRHRDENKEAILLKRFQREIPHRIGDMDDDCKHCGAWHWRKEIVRARGPRNPAHYTMCCRGGKVELPQHYFKFPPVPVLLYELLTKNDWGGL